MSLAFQVTRKVRDAVILNLRRIFNGDPKYPYVETIDGEFDFDQSKVFISDILPQEHAALPAIVVDTVSGAEIRYLGPDDLGETKNNDFEVTNDRLFTSIDMTVNINIYTINDTISRDELTDRIYDHFKLITDDLAEQGIEIKKTIFNPDRRNFLDNRWYYVATYTLEVYTEWVDDLGAPELVSGLNIDLQLNP